MHRQANQSLISKLELILAWAIGLAGMLALALTLSDEIIARKNTLIEQTRAWVQALSIQVQSPLMFDDQKTALEVLQTSSVYPNIMASWISKPGNDTFAIYLSPHVASINLQALEKTQREGLF